MRVAGADGFIPETELVHHSRTKVFNQHVRLGDEVADFLQIGMILEVCGIALLVAVDRVEERAVTLDAEVGDIQLPADVAGAGTLDLDHARAKVREAHGGCGACQKLGEIENDEIFERFHLEKWKR